MPKARVTVPIEIEVTDAQADALRAAGDVATRARDAGVFEALGRLARAGAAAVREHRRRPRRG